LVDPEVSADRVELVVPLDAAPHFAVLDRLLTRSVRAARAGLLLGLPTQPEMVEMRSWLCGQVSSQAEGAEPVAWQARTDVRVPLAIDAAQRGIQREFAALEVASLATNEASVIVAVTPSLLEILGYDDPSALVGRRLLVVIPARFHQAHIAGTTLHATNGRDVLLNRWLTVPAVRADGTEIDVQLHVATRRTQDEKRLFVAEFRVTQP
jgi:PAS domain S-box-containing protein